MKAVNLLLLTRARDSETMSLLFQELAALRAAKKISPHEADSLYALADCLTGNAQVSFRGTPEWMALFDGFFFSYTIEHIGKEFDLLKISSDGGCVLNIELKSEDIGQQRIKKQLGQNRYYLSHTAGTIFSFTFVSDTGTLYSMNDKGYLKTCTPGDLIRVLQRPDLADCLADGIDRFFRSSDYLISPVAAPEKFLQGQYFLTNQQFDFRRKILEHIKTETSPVISVTGSAGTGKTLLLFDLAMKLSEKSRVLLVHSGPLRLGHMKIDRRLKNVDIRSADDLAQKTVKPENTALPAGSVTGKPAGLTVLSGCSYLLVYEADHIDEGHLRRLLSEAADHFIPVILAYDPHRMLGEILPSAAFSETIQLIESLCTLSLAFTGNIRINRPVYSFLRTLLHLNDHPGHPDYSCIDVICANHPSELNQIVRYYTARGYKWIRTHASQSREDVVIAQEYEKVLLVLNEDYYYDKNLHLCVKDSGEDAIRLIYEALSRTRDRLCLIIMNNPQLFLSVLQIRLHADKVEQATGWGMI